MYAVHFDIPKNTPFASPAKYSLEIAPCLIKKVQVVIPGGCVDLIKLWVEYQSARLYPTNDDGYFMGNDTVIQFAPNTQIIQPPFILDVFGVNEDSVYSHSPSVYFDVEFLTVANVGVSEVALITQLAHLNTRR